MSEYKFGFTGFKTAEEAMGEKKYVVPEGMMEAYRQGLQPILKASADRNHKFNQDDLERAGVEAALRWQSENPPVPSYKQLLELSVLFDGKEPPTPRRQYYAEWIRRMYVATEPDYDSGRPDTESNYYNIPQALREAAYTRIRQFDGRIGDGMCTDNRIDMILEEAKMFYAPEPEVPKEIKDLQVNDLDMGWDGPINKRILEAYRRGLKAGERA